MTIDGEDREIAPGRPRAHPAGRGAQPPAGDGPRADPLLLLRGRREGRAAHRLHVALIGGITRSLPAVRPRRSGRRRAPAARAWSRRRGGRRSSRPPSPRERPAASTWSSASPGTTTTPSASPTTQSPGSTATSPTVTPDPPIAPARFFVAPGNARPVENTGNSWAARAATSRTQPSMTRPATPARLGRGGEHLTPVAELALVADVDDQRRARAARATPTWIARLSPGVHRTGYAGAASTAPVHAGRIRFRMARAPDSPSVAEPRRRKAVTCSSGSG